LPIPQPGERDVMISVPGTSLRLDGRTVVVIGASRGIGAACAEAARHAGARVIGISRNAAAGGSDSADSISLDVCDTDAVERFFGSLGPVDGVINAAGTNRPGPADAVDTAAYDSVFSVNARASYFVLKSASAAMIRAGRGGSLITISSQMGHVGAANRTVYCASKHAVEGMSKAFALELALHNIRVNTIAPTFTATELTEPMLADPAFRADVLAKIPLGRIGKPADVAGAAVFLLSPASGLVTGTSLVVDGGWTAV
jgi:NAD(P)-dependent dehydrogenase (short-subunit alcohol dehydrogenase family)